MLHVQKDQLTVFQSRMFQLNSAVVQTEDLILIVDPGYFPDEIEEIRQFVDSIKGDKPLYLFFTHSDWDHIVGYGAFPDARTIASKDFVESPLRESQMEDAIKYDDEFYITRPYPLEYPSIDYVMDKDGSIQVGQTTIWFYPANGHNNDGLIAAIESPNLLIVGDYLSDIEFPFIYHSFHEYKETLKVLGGLQLTMKNLTLVPGHGNVTSNSSEVRKRIEESREYIELIENHAGQAAFEKFMTDKNYQFKTVLKRRHQNNLEQYKKE